MNAPSRLFLVRKENPSRAQIQQLQQLEFAHECPITDSERAFLSRFLAYHPAAQIIVDELVGQVRQRGRGQSGIKSPRALASLLAREAIAHGTEFWYHWQDEAELRQVGQGATDNKPSPEPTQPLALARARPETLAAARIETQKIRERHAERQLQLLQGGKK